MELVRKETLTRNINSEQLAWSMKLFVSGYILLWVEQLNYCLSNTSGKLRGFNLVWSGRTKYNCSLSAPEDATSMPNLLFQPSENISSRELYLIGVDSDSLRHIWSTKYDWETYEFYYNICTYTMLHSYLIVVIKL